MLLNREGQPIRIAIVHDWLVTYAGAERVLEQILLCFPGAEIFSIVDFLDQSERGFILNKEVRTSFIQHLPMAKYKYRSYFPLMPLAIEQFDLSRYELIISSSHAIAKGILVGPNQLHVCMCYSPMRYAWDFQHQYLSESGLQVGIKSWMVRMLLHKIRLWDVRTSNGVDSFIAISKYISRRIEKAYRRTSTVIYPPVDVSSFELETNKEEYYITASRMVPYKKIPMIVEAFRSIPEKKLIVIGDGPDFKRCKSLAGENVELMGWQPSEILLQKIQKAKAFIFAAEEDFGIAPLEAQACGTPVIAFGGGAIVETIRGQDDNDPTGIFFFEQTPASLLNAIANFELLSEPPNPLSCRQNALRFSTERFILEFKQFIADKWESFSEKIK